MNALLSWATQDDQKTERGARPDGQPKLWSSREFPARNKCGSTCAFADETGQSTAGSAAAFEKVADHLRWGGTAHSLAAGARRKRRPPDGDVTLFGKLKNADRQQAEVGRGWPAADGEDGRSCPRCGVPDAEVMMRRGTEPVLVKGRGTVKALSAEFLDDLQLHWRKSRDQILDDVAKKYPQQYFAGMAALARIVRWEIGAPGDFERPRSPAEIIQKLEERVGPEGRKIFERSLTQVSHLQEKQPLRRQVGSPAAPEGAGRARGG